ncbi:hypothetical protein HDV05_001826, partial [Chytridiales sp. JEL 0842]
MSKIPLTAQSFPHLLRSSTFTSLTSSPSGSFPQILTTSPQLRAKGEWGLKHTLPTDLTHSTVMVAKLDEKELGRGCVFKSGAAEVGRIKRWKEAFGVGTPEESIPAESLRAKQVAQAVSEGASVEKEAMDLASLTSKEFDKLLKDAAEKRAEFLSTVPEEKQQDVSEWERFLGVTSTSSTLGNTASASLDTVFTDSPNSHLTGVPRVHPPFYKPLKPTTPQHKSSIDAFKNFSIPKPPQQQQLQQQSATTFQKPLTARYLNPVSNQTGHTVAID